MKPNKAYYCLIQYCPDRSRLEAANIGVLLFCPEKLFLQARTSRDNARIRHFFGSEGHDWKRINSFKKGLEERLEVEHSKIQSLEDLEKFVATRANEFQITPPRPLKVLRPEEELDVLFKELVGGRHRKEHRTTFPKYLAEKFQTAGIANKLRRNIELTVPLFEREIILPYGYQNGRFHLIQPVRFESSDPKQSINTACHYAVEGRSFYEHPHPDFGELQLIVVGKFRANDEEAQGGVKRVLEGHSVRLFSLPELPNLIDEIRQTAQEVSDTT